MMIECMPCVDDDEHDTESDERREDDLSGEIIRFQSRPPRPGVMGWWGGGIEGWSTRQHE